MTVWTHQRSWERGDFGFEGGEIRRNLGWHFELLESLLRAHRDGLARCAATSYDCWQSTVRGEIASPATLALRELMRAGRASETVDGWRMWQPIGEWLESRRSSVGLLGFVIWLDLLLGWHTSDSGQGFDGYLGSR